MLPLPPPTSSVRTSPVATATSPWRSGARPSDRRGFPAARARRPCCGTHPPRPSPATAGTAALNRSVTRAACRPPPASHCSSSTTTRSLTKPRGGGCPEFRPGGDRWRRRGGEARPRGGDRWWRRVDRDRDRGACPRLWILTSSARDRALRGADRERRSGGGSGDHGGGSLYGAGRPPTGRRIDARRRPAAELTRRRRPAAELTRRRRPAAELTRVADRPPN